jgi:hypothetical protein
MLDQLWRIHMDKNALFQGQEVQMGVERNEC